MKSVCAECGGAPGSNPSCLTHGTPAAFDKAIECADPLASPIQRPKVITAMGRSELLKYIVDLEEERDNLRDTITTSCASIRDGATGPIPEEVLWLEDAL